jgi:hypothetical protein
MMTNLMIVFSFVLAFRGYFSSLWVVHKWDLDEMMTKWRQGAISSSWVS